MPNYQFCLTVLALITLTIPAGAGITLFDFESPQDLAAWTLRTPNQDSLKLSNKFATSGSSSLEFHTPAWQSGNEQWPAFQCVPPTRDWRGYDRLILDVSNAAAYDAKLFAYISDSVGDFRKSYGYTLELPVKGSKRHVLDLNKLPDCVNRADISIIHFFTERPKDLLLYLDTITLLKVGDKQPPMPDSMLKATVNSLKSKLEQTQLVLSQCRAAMPDSYNASLVACQSRANKLAVDLESISGMDADRLKEIETDLDQTQSQSERLLCLAKLQNSCKSLGVPSDPMLVGFASSMEKILPRDMPVSLRAAKSVSLAAARNETESFQVAVTPAGLGKLREVTVKVSDLRSKTGDMLACSNIDCDVVGYVQTKSAPPYKVPYVGWWPDPILDFLDQVDISAGDVQTFWIRVNVPKGQNPGTYKGTLTVSANGVEPMKFGVSMKVRSFTMPDCTPIPTAITCRPTNSLINNLRAKGEWLANDYADFLADYYMDFDSLYESGPPDYEVLKHLHDQGRLVAFNFGYFGGDVQRNIDRFRPIYDKCKQMGIIDRAYIYGFDESRVEDFPSLESAAKAMKKEFPDVLLMTTAYDQSFGMDSAVKSIDAWCPLTPSFDPERVSRAREAGKKVWWYICCGPQRPFANWFVECDAIEARLLMGAMTAKYHPDGFLYYQTTIWNDNVPITTGPFTTWNPVSWTTFHGDGSLFCCGPGGKPLPTIRLENYRDGMEDNAYAKILEEIIRVYEAKGNSMTQSERKWLDDARKVVVVPNELVKHMSEYSRDPGVLYAWRNRVGDMIDTSGMSDTDPWGPNFGVRGFENK